MRWAPALAAAVGSLVFFAACTPDQTVVINDPAPQGWTETGTDGIYFRFCTENPECSSGAVIGDNRYVLMQVWCKARACGDIYARVNLLNDAGTVVGWTNDTAYGDVGQKVQLTFDSFQEDWVNARLTEFQFS